MNSPHPPWTAPFSLSSPPSSRPPPGDPPVTRSVLPATERTGVARRRADAAPLRLRRRRRRPPIGHRCRVRTWRRQGGREGGGVAELREAHLRFLWNEGKIGGLWREGGGGRRGIFPPRKRFRFFLRRGDTWPRVGRGRIRAPILSFSTWHPSAFHVCRRHTLLCFFKKNLNISGS